MLLLPIISALPLFIYPMFSALPATSEEAGFTLSELPDDIVDKILSSVPYDDKSILSLRQSSKVLKNYYDSRNHGTYNVVGNHTRFINERECEHIIKQKKSAQVRKLFIQKKAATTCLFAHSEKFKNLKQLFVSKPSFNGGREITNIESRLTYIQDEINDWFQLNQKFPQAEKIDIIYTNFRNINTLGLLFFVMEDVLYRRDFTTFYYITGKIQEIVQSGKTDVNYGHKSGLTAIHFAVFHGLDDLLNLLISNGANVNIIGKMKGLSERSVFRFTGHTTPIRIALQFIKHSTKRNEILETLLNNGAVLNQVYPDGTSDLDYASVVENYDEVISLFKKYGANQEHIAANEELGRGIKSHPPNVDLVVSALEKGAVLNAFATGDRKTYRDLAILTCDLELNKLMFKHGLSMSEVKDFLDREDSMARPECYKLLKYLTKNGFEPSIKFLHKALKIEGNLKVILLLMDNISPHENMDIISSFDDILRRVIETGDMEVLEFFFKQGFILESALFWATEFNNPEAIELCKKYGIKRSSKKGKSKGSRR